MYINAIKIQIICLTNKRRELKLVIFNLKTKTSSLS